MTAQKEEERGRRQSFSKKEGLEFEVFDVASSRKTTEKSDCFEEEVGEEDIGRSGGLGD